MLAGVEFFLHRESANIPATLSFSLFSLAVADRDGCFDSQVQWCGLWQ